MTDKIAIPCLWSRCHLHTGSAGLSSIATIAWTFNCYDCVDVLSFEEVEISCS